jgi:hypothetical protein
VPALAMGGYGLAITSSFFTGPPSWVLTNLTGRGPSPGR